MAFGALALHPQLLSRLSSLNFIQPTDIQAQAIPVILSGKDVMAGAQTGTGKTAAFCLPILHQLLSQQALSQHHHQQARAPVASCRRNGRAVGRALARSGAAAAARFPQGHGRADALGRRRRYRQR